jgi:hypothetical protein
MKKKKEYKKPAIKKVQLKPEEVLTACTKLQGTICRSGNKQS